MSIFQKDNAGIQSDNETLENSDEWLLSKDSDVLDSDDEKTTSDSGYEFDEESAGIVRNNVNRFEIHTNSNMSVWKRIETKDDKIAIEKLVATYADKPAKDIDPLSFLLLFLDCFPNEQGLPNK
jgi:hypothetical protein